MAQKKFRFKQNILDLILSFPDTEMKEIMLEGVHLLEFAPECLDGIAGDVDLLAKGKKADRIAERDWYLSLSLDLPGMQTGGVFPEAESLVLLDGRPRKLDAEAIFFLMLIRAHLDSVTSKAAVDRIVDSHLINAYFESRGMRLPSANTILDHLNAVSNDTRNFIFEKLITRIVSEGWDTMDVVGVDSFSVWANTDWPTDSLIILKLLKRAYSLGMKLTRMKLLGFTEGHIPGWLQELKKINFKLSCLAGKPKSKSKIKKLYRKFLKMVDKILSRMIRQYSENVVRWSRLSLSPLKQRKVTAITNGITQDIERVIHVYQYASDRVFHGIPLPAPEKILSLSDESATFIKKGSRESVIGYKPQVGRTGQGFITTFEIQEGNPKDSTRLEPLIHTHVFNTDIIPETVTVDDGYSCRKTRNNLLAMPIPTVSINGAKGRKITPSEDWENETYQSARNARSAVESLIFTLRFKFHLYRFTRRGIDAVKAELIEKIIAYNLWRIAYLRKQRLRHIVA